MLFSSGSLATELHDNSRVRAADLKPKSLCDRLQTKSHILTLSTKTVMDCTDLQLICFFVIAVV